MKLNVLLIRPPVVLSKGRIGSVTSTPPTGIAYLAAHVRKQDPDININLIDAFGERPTEPIEFDNYTILGLTNEEMIARIPENTDVIGLSCMFSNEWFYTKAFIPEIRKKCPNAKIILGGEHATALPEYILESCPDIDFIGTGEGEETFYEFLQCIGGDHDLREVSGLVYRRNGTIVANPKGRKQRIRKIDDIPWPAWDLVPIENYLKEGIATLTSKGKRIMPILASRGCPYACKFCSNPIMWDAPYIMRSADEVIKEIKYYKEQYHITDFEFQDLTLMVGIVGRNWMLEFCDKLETENLNLNYNIPTTRSESIDEEVIEALARTGCTNICLTPDSGSKFQVREMGKRVDLKKVVNAVQLILKAGINLKVNLVIGFPKERHRNVIASLFYGMKLAFLGVNSVLFYRFVPYPGSEYFRNLQNQGILPKEGDGFDAFLSINTYNEMVDVRSFSNHISHFFMKMYLFGGYALCQLIFYLIRPWEIFYTFKRVFSNKATTQADLLLSNLFQQLKIIKSQ